MKKTVPLQRFLRRIMHITISQLLLAALFCSVSLAHSLRGQEILAKEISIHMESVEISKILNQLEKQAKVKFIYSSQSIQLKHKASVTAENKPLISVLDELFSPIYVQYEVVGSRIILRRKPAEKRRSDLQTLLPDRSISGIVRDENGEGLPGVNVLIKGSQTGTITNGLGEFELSVPGSESILVFSFVGYETQEVIVGDQSQFSITLNVDTKALEEIVVVGYGTQKKANIAGAVDQIAGKQLEARPIANLMQGLQGISPGLNITYGGGQPGQVANINIRGYTSINGG